MVFAVAKKIINYLIIISLLIFILSMNFVASKPTYAADPLSQYRLYLIDVRELNNKPDIIAFANTADTASPPEFTITVSGEFWRFHQWISLTEKGSWIRAATNIETDCIGVQLWGDQTDGWALITVDGSEVWRGNTYGKSGKYPGDAFANYIEIYNIPNAKHTIQVEALGINGDGGAPDVTVFFFGLRKTGSPEATMVNLPTPVTSAQPASTIGSETVPRVTSVDALKTLSMVNGAMAPDMKLDLDEDKKITRDDAVLVLKLAIDQKELEIRESQITDLKMEAQVTLPLSSATTTTGTVSSSGGVVQSGNMKLIVPQGAVTQDTEVLIQETSKVPTVPDSKENQSALPVLGISKIYDVGPPGIKFQKPVTLEIPYDDSQMSSCCGSETENIGIAYFNGNGWVAQPGIVDTDRKVVTIKATEFPGSLLEVVVAVGGLATVLFGIPKLMEIRAANLPQVTLTQYDEELTDAEVEKKNNEAMSELMSEIGKIKEWAWNANGERTRSLREIAERVNDLVDLRVHAFNNGHRNWIFTNPQEPISAVEKGGVYLYVLETRIDDFRKGWCDQYDVIAIWTWNNRRGRCQEHACLTYFILKNLGIPCEICAQTRWIKDPKTGERKNVGDHAVVVTNIQGGESLVDPREWSEAVILVDPWMGEVLSGSEAYSSFAFQERKYWLTIATPTYTNNYKSIKSRNIVWDSKDDTWKCRKGYFPGVQVCTCAKKLDYSKYTRCNLQIHEVDVDAVSNYTNEIWPKIFPDWRPYKAPSWVVNVTAEGNFDAKGKFHGSLMDREGMPYGTLDVQVGVDGNIVNFTMNSLIKEKNGEETTKIEFVSPKNPVVFDKDNIHTQVGIGFWLEGDAVCAAKVDQLLTRKNGTKVHIKGLKCNKDSHIKIEFRTGQEPDTL